MTSTKCTEIENIEFRSLSMADIPLMHKWFNKPHVRQFYSLSDSSVDEVLKNSFNTHYIPEKLGFKLEGEMENFFINLDTNELFNAFLYIGSSESWKVVDIPRSVFTENEWKELNRRRKMVGAKPFDDDKR